jgi:hypothetical protein
MPEREKTEEMNLLEILNEVAISQTDLLEDRARSLSREFWGDQVDRNKGVELSEKGQLGCRVRTKGDHGSIYLEWYRTQWFKPAGATKAKPRGKYIKKGKKDPFGYNIETLKKMAKPIEAESVVETEKAFRILREQNYCLTQLRKYAKQLEEVNAKWEALSEGDQGE